MKQTPLTLAIDRLIALKLKAVDRLVEELVEPLADVGSPEKLIGKKYEQWTKEDTDFLGKVYGKEPNALSELVFKKVYQAVKEMEKEEL